MKLHNYIRETIEKHMNLSTSCKHGRMNKVIEWYNDHSRLSRSGSFSCCSSCDCHVHDDALHMAYTDYRASDETYICESCHDSCFTCRNCSNTYTEAVDSYETRSGRTICQSCYDDDYFTCGNCDEVLSMDDYADDGYCNSCHEPDEDEDGIPEYHSQPRHQVACGSKAPLFGVELEIKCKEGYVTDVYTDVVNNGFIGERDGSLDCDYGLEIVAPPLSYEQARERWLPLLKKIRGRAVGWDAGTNYGMHISLNRLAFSVLHQGKIICFIHNNKTLCEKVAGRKEVHWASYHQKKINVALRHCDEKYQAISLRSEQRMEIRIFRSTIAPEGFQRNLEFSAAVVEFTRIASAVGLTEDCFRSWLDRPTNRKHYPNLFEWLNPVAAGAHRTRKLRHVDQSQVNDAQWAA